MGQWVIILSVDRIIIIIIYCINNIIRRSMLGRDDDDDGVDTSDGNTFEIPV